MAAFLSPSAQDSGAVDLWEAKIEHRRIVGFGLAEMLAIFAIGSDIDGEILVTQGLSDLLRKKTIIFDKKNFHIPGQLAEPSPKRPSITQPEPIGSGWVWRQRGSVHRSEE